MRAALLVIAIAIFSLPLPCLASDRSNYDTQAIFIQNLVKFVRWPAERFEDAEAPIVVGVPAGSPVGARLIQRLAGKRIQGRPVSVQEFDSAESAVDFHLAFLGDGSGESLRRISRMLRGSSTVSVAESKRFAERGGVVGFQMVGSKVQFEINRRTAKRGGIEFSSRLLELASEVY
jgi:hypothetical protein